MHSGDLGTRGADAGETGRRDRPRPRRLGDRQPDHEAGSPARNVTLADVTVVDGELVTVLAATRDSGRDALTRALRNHDTPLAVEAPYIDYGSQPGADKNPWHTTEPPQRVHREVPLDVAFAGMPDA